MINPNETLLLFEGGDSMKNQSEVIKEGIKLMQTEMNRLGLSYDDIIKTAQNYKKSE